MIIVLKNAEIVIVINYHSKHFFVELLMSIVGKNCKKSIW